MHYATSVWLSTDLADFCFVNEAAKFDGKPTVFGAMLAKIVRSGVNHYEGQKLDADGKPAKRYLATEFVADELMKLGFRPVVQLPPGFMYGVLYDSQHSPDFVFCFTQTEAEADDSDPINIGKLKAAEVWMPAWTPDMRTAAPAGGDKAKRGAKAPAEPKSKPAARAKAVPPPAAVAPRHEAVVTAVRALNRRAAAAGEQAKAGKAKAGKAASAAAPAGK